MTDNQDSSLWVHCPICGGKTRTKVYEALGRMLENRKGAKATTIDGYSNFLFLNRDGCLKTNVNYATMFRGLQRSITSAMRKRYLK